MNPERQPTGPVPIEITTSFLVDPDQAQSPEWQARAREAFAALGMTMAAGSEVSVSFDTEARESDDRLHALTHTRLQTLLETHADKSRPGWKQSVGLAVTVLHSRRITTPATMIALGREHTIRSFKNQKKVIERIDNLMDTIGLRNAWKDEPNIGDIVPYCDLSDVLVDAVPGCEPSKVSITSVAAVLGKSQTELSLYLTSGKKKHSPEAASLYQTLTAYAEEFTRQKRAYKQSQNGGE